jgi:hypothetical protein
MALRLDCRVHFSKEIWNVNVLPTNTRFLKEVWNDNISEHSRIGCINLSSASKHSRNIRQDKQERPCWLNYRKKFEICQCSLIFFGMRICTPYKVSRKRFEIQERDLKIILNFTSLHKKARTKQFSSRKRFEKNGFMNETCSEKLIDFSIFITVLRLAFEPVLHLERDWKSISMDFF